MNVTFAGRQWSFPSKSDPNKTYYVKIDGNNRIGCDCRGWTRYKNKMRECVHTNEVIAKHGLKYRVEGDYQYIVSAASVTGNAAPPTAPKAAKVPDGLNVGAFIDPDKPSTKVPPAAAPKPSAPKIVTPYCEPMLACPTPEGFTLQPNEWIAEEKYDGQRCTAVVVQGQSVELWSRPRAGEAALRRTVEPHIGIVLKTFPTGTYDGEEFVMGGKCYDVRKGGNEGRKVFIVFDLLRLHDGTKLNDTTTLPQTSRRKLLEEIFSKRGGWAVQLSSQTPVQSVEDVVNLAKSVWARGGEGLIVKRKNAVYRPGARSADWIKVKKVAHAVLTIIGYEAGKLGPQSIVQLRDDEGNTTTVKVKDTALLRDIEANHAAYIGRRVVIEYNERTAAGKYREPRWDRWENQ